MTPLGLYAAPGLTSSATTDAILASLPLSYASAQTTEGNVVVVGGSPDWPAAAADALAAGATAVLVVLPEPADVGYLVGRGGLVVLDTRWAPNPVVKAAAVAFGTAMPAAGRLECEVRLPVGSSLGTALVDQLGLVRALLGPVSCLHVLFRSRHGYAAEGMAAGHPVDLSLVCTDAAPERAAVRLLTDAGAVDLMIPGGRTAQPARLSVTTAEGVLLAPSLYESAHRASWRRVRAHLLNRSTSADLEDFTSDQNAALTALRLDEG